MTPVSKLSREAVEGRLHRFLATGNRDVGRSWAEGYEFNIKIYGFDIPDEVYRYASQDKINDVVNRVQGNRLRDFAEGLVEKFTWIADWSQAGRGGGWLVLATNKAVLDFEYRVVSLQKARKRLKDLREIARLVRMGIEELKLDLASHSLWRRALEGYEGGTYKDWDPRGVS